MIKNSMRFATGIYSIALGAAIYSAFSAQLAGGAGIGLACFGVFMLSSSIENAK